MKLVHWPLMGGLLHLVQRGGDWVGSQPAQNLYSNATLEPPLCIPRKFKHYTSVKRLANYANRACLIGTV